MSSAGGGPKGSSTASSRILRPGGSRHRAPCRPDVIGVLSRPAGMPCGGGCGQHLASPRALAHPFRAAPLLRNDKQCAAIGAAERAREAAAIALQGVEDLAALADPHAAPIANVGVPHSAV